MTSNNRGSGTGLEIAVVGMALRVPGAVTVGQFWSNLRGGVESIRHFGREELLAAGVSPAELADPSYVPANGVLEGIELFDADFFGFTPREATLMDPQHRMYLECAWHALEDAGENPDIFAGEIGVFAGAGLSTYLLHNLGAGAVSGQASSLHALLGNDKDHVATRVAYKLDLTGPAVGVQTACSSSLTAVHMAVQALLGGECDMALAGGVSITVPQIRGYRYEEEGIYSPDGHCRAFDREARGTVGGSGAAVLVLKRLETAQRDSNTIRAVIKGSAVNNDGASKIGYTAPSVERQAQVIRAAQLVAETPPATIALIEAHGTATPLGDLIELEALQRAFGEGANDEPYCAVGSVKTNIGHLDSAAGVVGLIKAVLALEHGEIPPSLHFRSPNPRVDLEGSSFFVPTEAREWRSDTAPRRAGVSSFGMGGTNVHVVVEEAPPRPVPKGGRPWNILTFSARSERSLERMIHQSRDLLATDSDTDLRDLTYTLHLGRRELTCRRALVAATVEDAIAELALERPPSKVGSGSPPPIAFLFPGQASQYPGMARELYHGEALFRDECERCLGALELSLAEDLRGLLLTDQSSPSQADQLARTEFAQPALFIVEWALAQLWISWGVRPAALIGHSLGEYVAAALAGVFGLEDALRVVAARGRLIGEQPPGSMTVVSSSPEALAGFLPEDIEIAAINERNRTVLSGPVEAMTATLQTLESAGVACLPLETSHASHSAMMAPVMAPLAELLDGVKLSAPETPLVSTLSGTWLEAAEATDPSYWSRQMKEPVQFAAGVQRLLEIDRGILIEIGPGSSLTAAARRHPARTASHTVVAPMPGTQRQISEHLAVLQALASVWQAGGQVNWKHFHAGEQRRRVPWVAYPFERHRFWVESSTTKTDEDSRVERLDFSEWFWVPTWTRTAPLALSRKRGPGSQERYLVLGEENPWCEAILDALRRQGVEIVELRPGPRFERLDEGVWTAEIDRREGYRDFLEARLEAGSITKIVHLWGIDAENESPSDRSVAASQAKGFYPLLYLAQAWAESRLRNGLDIVLVTAGGQSVTGAEILSVVDTPKVGLGRAIAQEMGGVRTWSVDLELLTQDLTGDAERVADEIVMGQPGSVVALRGGQRWVADVAPVDLRIDGETTLPEGAVCLITGGLGGVGLEIARVLAETRRARLVLVGRTAEPEDQIADSALQVRLRALEDSGGQVLLAPADVADPKALESAFQAAAERFGPVDAVFHVAGSPIEPRPIQDLTSEDCERVFHAKLQGLETLAEVTERHSPRWCCVISSLSSLLGAVGFAPYAAAHVFMDAFVLARRRDSKVAWTTVNLDNWYTWKTAVPAPLPVETDFFMTPEEGRGAVKRILAAPNPPQLLVSTGDLRARLARWVRQGDGVSQGPPDHRLVGHTRPELGVPYVAPQTAEEEILVRAWSEALGIEAIGIDDDFFDLGGDSVNALQIVAASAAAGLRLKVRDVFEKTTVRELVSVASLTQGVTAEQEVLHGPVPLSPIQKWFFAQQRPEPHHFNMPMMVEITGEVSSQEVAAALQRLVEHHDGLRLRFPDPQSGVGVIVQEIEKVPLEIVDLTGLPAPERAQDLRLATESAQVGLDLAAGPLLRGVLFRSGAQSLQLLLVVHHLLVDVRSWMILLEDLANLLSAMQRGEDFRLPRKTVSFGMWSRKLEQLTPEIVDSEERFWSDQLMPKPVPLPRDGAGENLEGSARLAVTCLDLERTRRLLVELPQRHHTPVQGVLLTAVGLAIAEWTAADSVTIDVESDGREADITGDFDLSRTVGWFTSLFPLRIEVSPADLMSSLDGVVRTLQDIPNEGVGYGLMSYGDLTSPRSQPRASSEVSFVYLGRSDLPLAGTDLVPLTADLGQSVAREQGRSHVLEIIARVRAEQLEIEVVYNRHLHDAATVEALVARLQTLLARIIDECGRHQPVYSPEDFPDAGLGADQLDRLVARLDIDQEKEPGEDEGQKSPKGEN